MSYKSCDNCLLKVTCGETSKYWCNNLPHEKAFWQPIPCPLCDGTLSGLRRSGGHFIRHCYSCNFDFPIDKDGNAIRLKEETT